MKNGKLFKKCFGANMDEVVYKFIVDFGLLDYEKIEKWESQENKYVKSVALKNE